MQIFIRDIKGREIKLHVSEDLTFREVKEKYYSASGDFTSVQFFFLCNGEEAKDEKRLCDYDIEDGDIIIAGPYPRGEAAIYVPMVVVEKFLIIIKDVLNY